MTESFDSFFDDAVRSDRAPGYKFATLGDAVSGEVLDQYQTEATVFAKPDEKKLDRDGKPIPQLVVVLQTDLRNWDHVTKIPLGEDGREKPATEDDGRRTVFLEKWTNIYAAVGQAVIEGAKRKGGVRNGGTLAIQWFDQQDTNKGNPLKKYRARYTDPSASGDFFATPQQTAAPAQAPVPAMAQGGPVANAPKLGGPAQDPWSGAPTTSVDEPPF